MKNVKTSWKEIVAVGATAVLVTFLTTIKLFAQLIRLPPNNVFIGMTHYFEDFYYYLDQFYQGAHGGWLTYNNFTPENLAPTTIYWSHILMGKIGGLLGLEAFTAYNLSLLILKFSFLVICYLVLKRIFPHNFWYRYFVFLVFLFSTSIPVGYAGEEGGMVYLPLRIWGTKNLISSRFGNIPYRYVINILFLTSLLMTWDLLSFLQTLYMKGKERIISIKRNEIIKMAKYLLPLAFLMLLLTLSDSAVALVLMGATIIAMFLARPKTASKQYFYTCLIIAVAMLIPFLLAGVYLVKVINTDPVYSQAVRWDVGQYFEQFQLIKPHEVLFSFGLLGLLVLLGLYSFIREKKNLFEQSSGIILLLCFCGFLFPRIFVFQFPGSRFLFSSVYLFAAVVGLYGFLTVERLLHLKILPILIVLYLIINLGTFRLSLAQEIIPLEEPDFHFTYMSNDFYQGLLFLRKLEPNNAIVLGNPDTSTDIMIPGLTGKKTYSGHLLTTLNVEEKDKLAHKFFYEKQKEEEALEFLRNNRIKYIILTSYSQYAINIGKEYPFLRELFGNKMIKIYGYD